MPPTSHHRQTGMPYKVERLATLDAFLACLAALGSNGERTLFQEPAFLRAWYEAYAERPEMTPLFLKVTHEVSGETVLMLPLVLNETGRLRIIEFPDAGVSDYNAPIVTPATPDDPAGAESLWQCIKQALPAADLIRLDKMPDMVGTRRNPLTLIPHAESCNLFGQWFDTGGDWSHYIGERNPKFAKDTRRRRRRLDERGAVEFEEVTDPEEAAIALHQLDEMQISRLEEAGRDHTIDEPATRQFYRRLYDYGQSGSFTRVFRLCVDGEVVAMLYGLARGDSFGILRITHAGPAWNNSSPGRLVIIEAIRYLERQGFRVFDLTIGDYFFKHLFRPEPYPLSHLDEGVSPLGRLWVGSIKLSRRFKTSLEDLRPRTARKDPKP